MSERKTERKAERKTAESAVAEHDAMLEAIEADVARLDKRWASAEAQHADLFVPDEERKTTAKTRLVAERLGREPPLEDDDVIARLTEENPGRLSDDVGRIARDMRTVESYRIETARLAQEDRAAFDDWSRTLRFPVDARADLDRSLQRLRAVQTRVVALMRDDQEYLDGLARNDDVAVRFATTHVEALDGPDEAEILRVALDALIAQRLPLERAYLRDRLAYELWRDGALRSQQEAKERENDAVAVRDAAVRLRNKLALLKTDLVEKLDYLARGDALPGDAIDEEEVEATCAPSSRTTPAYRAGKVCKEAAGWAADVACTVRDPGQPTSALTGDEVAPEDRIRMRFKKITGPSGAGDARTVTRCFDIASLKYMIAVNRAENVRVLEPETKLPLSEAQLRRVDALPWPASSDLPRETYTELLELLESKTQSLEAVQRRAELAKRLAWLNYGSSGLADTIPDVDARRFVYSDDAYWWKVARNSAPGDLAKVGRPPAISATTRRQSTYVH